MYICVYVCVCVCVYVSPHHRLVDYPKVVNDSAFTGPPPSHLSLLRPHLTCPLTHTHTHTHTHHTRALTHTLTHTHTHQTN